MFPLLGVQLSGLEPDRIYHVAVDMVPVDQLRYRYIYQRSQWTINGSAADDDDMPSQTSVCQHPSVVTCRRQTAVTFDKLKLTNHQHNCNKHVRSPLAFLTILQLVAFYRATLAKRGICRRRVSVCLSVCLFVCLTHSGILSKRLNVDNAVR